MHRVRRANDACMLYLAELGARVAASCGRASQRHHLGRLLLLAMRDAPDFLAQIDGSTGESETCGSVVRRSVRCAGAMRAAGVERGDVIALMGANHLHVCVPFYAALYLGAIAAPLDRTLTVHELKESFSVVKPTMVFCEVERAADVQCALNEAELSARIVVFSPGDYLTSFQQFLDECPQDLHVDEFQAEDLEPAETVALLIATSGTTGLPKAAAATHYNFSITGPYWLGRLSEFPTPTRLALVGSPLQWLTAIFHFLFSPLLRYTRLQSARALECDHAYHLINTYRPSFAVLSPTALTALLRAAEGACDLSCFELILLGGSATPPDLIREFQEISPGTEVRNVYGMSELTCVGFHPDSPDPAAAGTPLGCFQYRLVNIETMEDVVEPHEQGELWVKGPGIFKEYYNNPEVTAEVFAEDGWFRTGDIFYRDPHWNFYFVERHKLLLKYMSHHISPVELEQVIRAHPGVLDVAVTGVRDARGDLPVACVVRHPAHRPPLSAQDVKDIVAEKLADSKRLRGGVVFVDAIPTTASTKVHRRRLQDIALRGPRE